MKRYGRLWLHGYVLASPQIGLFLVRYMMKCLFSSIDYVNDPDRLCPNVFLASNIQKPFLHLYSWHVLRFKLFYVHNVFILKTLENGIYIS